MIKFTFLSSKDQNDWQFLSERISKQFKLPQYLRDQPRDLKYVRVVAKGDFETLRYLWCRGYFIGPYAFTRAVIEGHLEIVKWLFGKRIYWVDPEACKNAVDDKHYDVFQWLISMNFPFVVSLFFSDLPWQRQR